LSILVPQALMGVAAVWLVYDLVKRRFGRPAGFVAGLALATTPTAVALARHNNPDELLLLCSVAAVWCLVRALETGRTRWLVWCGICVGLGFETKMGVALTVAPGLFAAYLWVAPRGRLRAFKQLLAGGLALIVVGGAWPLLVTLTPAADRPWISGTSDNTIWSLIFGYNGLGRVVGQAGGPQAFAGGGTMFGGATGPFRLLQTGLGDQAGWLLGFALVSGLGLLVISRLKRRDPRTGWLIAVGGALLVPAVVFSLASGIFHPYYVSLLAPFIAALIGAGVGTTLGDRRAARVLAPLAISGGAVTELVVLNETGGRLSWAVPLVIGIGGACALVLATALSARARPVVLVLALVALMAAPATWAAETLGHATGGTFPAGGPAIASLGGPGGPGPGFGRPGPGGSGPGGYGSGGFGPGGSGPRGAVRPSAGVRPGGGPPPFFGGAQGGFGPGAPPAFLGGRPGGFPGAGPGGFGPDSATLNAVIRYTEAHGGGTIGVESQSSAATEILSANANIAGLGGFSGRESSVSAAWIAQAIKTGRLRWIVGEGSRGRPGDTRTGSRTALTIVAERCKAVTVTSNASTATVYDCFGRASAILRAAQAMRAEADK
jgi:4-amino-4-deoxy-L-arabinose transferase-like glycosyltransferase